MTHTPHKGFTLLIAVILSAVALGIGLSLLDIAYKQSVLASSAKQSQYAFYAADGALECGLYYDQKLDSFDYTDTSGSVTCNNQTASVTFDNTASPRTRTFTIPAPASPECPSGGTVGFVKVYKSSDNTTQIFATGYNTCDTTNPRRIERGLKIFY